MVTFVMKIDQLGFVEAVDRLMGTHNLSTHEDHPTWSTLRGTQIVN